MLETSPHERPNDRIPEILGALAPLPCPVDLFVLTREEFERGRAENAPLVRLALEKGLDLMPP